MSTSIDYKSAGVDIEAGNEAVRRIKSHTAATHSAAVLTGVGSFGTLFSLRDATAGMADPIMVQSTDGVGTKTKVTTMAPSPARYEQLGRDLVAAVAGDIAVMGARPLTFLDYLGFHKTDPAIVEALVRGMSAACQEAGIALVGGETAEMPAVYAEGDLDVVGFVTGVVDREKLITGETIAVGDIIYGIGSTGLHTNGWSLARKLLFDVAGHTLEDTPQEFNGATLGDILLEPHANYVAPIRRALDAGLPIKGMAHITGGGLIENVPRILPEGLGAVINADSWASQPIFAMMQQIGNVDHEEMHRVFNMGIGLAIVAPAGILEQLTAAFAPFPVWQIGRIDNNVTGTILRTRKPMIPTDALIAAIPACLTSTALPLPNKYPGKVRDTYDLPDNRLLLVTTDRQSGFDRMLGAIPYKGQVLNQTALWWFERTRHIIPNHIISSPHANALIARKARVLPIEFVVRGFLTGSTDTAIWTKYAAGEREFCGHILPQGMKKNQRLRRNIVTPTTKEKDHDRPISSAAIIAEGWTTEDEWQTCFSKALELFQFGQDRAAEHGLILVDTKYEFGVTDSGEIILVDEIHTPDSSRYWIADSYPDRLAQGLEPEMIDKEFFRLWFRERCDPYADAELPTPPPELIAELASRYIRLFELITDTTFAPDLRPLEATIMAALK